MSNAQNTADQAIEKLTADEKAMELRVAGNTVDAAHQAELAQDAARLEAVDQAPTPPPAPAPTPPPATTPGA